MIVYFEANRSVYIYLSKSVNIFKSIVADKKLFARVTFPEVILLFSLYQWMWPKSLMQYLMSGGLQLCFVSKCNRDGSDQMWDTN